LVVMRSHAFLPAGGLQPFVVNPSIIGHLCHRQDRLAAVDVSLAVFVDVGVDEPHSDLAEHAYRGRVGGRMLE
jgi:hypothetical protein